ncbi:hypothetical protein DAI22_03g183650 [Oryza sativa Japonica Group]|nr:hypothetical protein DAI22_03g183650 [Oryza sativa Japonica Group]
MEYHVGGVIGQSPKPKVVFVLGATATGKSKLAISIAERFGGEVINSDKIQVHDGFPIITNKVTEEERAGVPHHLLGVLHPDADFTAEDFRREAAAAVARVLAAGRLPVVAGGSNTYVEALVEGGGGAFRAAHDCLFLWTDVAPGLLRWYTAARVDDMVRRGLVGEARAGFVDGAGAADYYTRGVRRAIGIPEMHGYLLASARAARRPTTASSPPCSTAPCARSRPTPTASPRPRWTGGTLRRVDATVVVARMAEGAPHRETWEAVVWKPCEEMVGRFLEASAAVDDDDNAAAGSPAALAPMTAACRLRAQLVQLQY